MIEISHLTKDQAVEYLLQILQTENKLPYIEAEVKNPKELADHEIITYWQKTNYREKFAWDTANKLSDEVNLASIVKQIKDKEQ